MIPAMDLADNEKQPEVEVHEEAPLASKSHAHGSRFSMWVGIFVLFIPLIVFIYCLCPTVFVGDAGDFLTASFTLGIPHPPGYPLYTMLGHVFMQLPIHAGLSEPAYRMNLMSAVCAWAACVFMFLFLTRVLRSDWTALVGALVLAFSSQFWQHAEIAEVYTMEVLFLTLIFHLAVLYVQERNVGWALLLAFIMGLALSHHYAVLVFYPGVLIYVGLNGGLKLRWYTWLLAIYLALMGLAPYAYLPLVHYKTPLGPVQLVQSDEEAEKLPMNVVAAKETPLQYFLYYTTRKFYSMGREYTLSSEVLPQRTTTPMVFKRFLEISNEDFGIPLLLFGILGWLALLVSTNRRLRAISIIGLVAWLPLIMWLPEFLDRFQLKRWSLGIMGAIYGILLILWLATYISRGAAEQRNAKSVQRAPKLDALLMPGLGWVIYFLVVHLYPSGDILGAPLENIAEVIPPLLIPLEVSTAAIIAFGFDAALAWIASYVAGQGVGEVEMNAKFRTFAALLAVAAFALVGVNAWKNAPQGDKSGSVISYNYALNVLDSSDPGAILLTTGDETFLFWYLQACEPSRDPDDSRPGYRKDVWATNWIHNLTDLSMLTNEPEAMKKVLENFIINSGYYSPELSNYFGPRPVNATFVAGSFSESRVIMMQEVILNGLTYLFRRPGDIPSLTTPGFMQRSDLGGVVEGAAPLMVIDYFDSKPFDKYRWGGLPRFEGIGQDLSSLDTSTYFRVNLEDQEKEVLGRYQDSLYRFGIQELLRDTPESAEKAYYYLFRCVSLDPAGWFGWKELGDSLLDLGRLDGAQAAYEEVVKLSAAKGDVPPDAEAGARAGIANVTLILHEYDTSEEQARAALILDPENRLEQAVLEEIQKAKARGLTNQPVTPPAPGEIQPPQSSEGAPSTGEGELHGFDTGGG